MMMNDSRIPYLKSIQETDLTDRQEFRSPQVIADTVRQIFDTDHLPEERVWLLAFDNRLQVIAIFEISHGTVNGSILTQTQVLQRALLCGAVSVAIVHNHPSGRTEPSDEDKSITKKIKRALSTCGINFIDHVIIGRDDYYSFHQNGMI